MLVKLLVVALALVSATRSQAPESANAHALQLDRLLDSPLSESMPKTFAGWAHFASLRRTTVSREKSVYEADTMIEHRVFEYEGLKIHALSSCPPCTKSVTELIEINSSKWPLRNGIEIGVPASQISQVMGKADEVTATSMEYCDDSMDCIRFFVAQSRIKTILISYYID